MNAVAAKKTDGRRGIYLRVRHLLLGAAMAWPIAHAAPLAAAVAPPPAGSTEQDVVIEKSTDIWDQEGAAWPRWSAHDDANKAAFDYSGWERFVADYSDPKDNRGALDFVHVVNRGMGVLGYYIFALERVPVSTMARDEQLAYWLNLHNAQAVVTTALSLRIVSGDDDTTRQLIMGEKWREKSLEVEGEKLSLVDIERRIVMRQWQDPRVLYGLYLPALGAPGLPATPFTGATVWKRLDSRAQEFVNSERASEFHDGQLHVSALYFWDRWLFPDDAAILDHLRAFAEPPLKSRLAGVQKVTATYLNWRINSFNSGYDRHQDHGASCPL